MPAAAAGVFSLFGPVIAGWLFVQRIWPGVPAGLRAGLGAALGTAFAGTVYFLGLLLFDSARFAFGASECAVGLTAVILLFNRHAALKNKTEPDSSNGVFGWIFALTA